MKQLIKSLIFVMLSVALVSLHTSCSDDETTTKVDNSPVAIQQRVDAYPRMVISDEAIREYNDFAQKNGKLYKAVKNKERQVGEVEKYQYYNEVTLKDADGNTIKAYYAWQLESRNSVSLTEGKSYYVILEDDGFGAQRIIAAAYDINQ